MRPVRIAIFLAGSILIAWGQAGSQGLTAPASWPTNAPADFTDCNGNGVDDTFETSVSFAENFVTFASTKIRLADFDDDGDLDAVELNPLTWYENLDGSGRFSPGQTITDTEGGTIWGSYLSDVDGDGDLDVAGAGDIGCHTIVFWNENLGGLGNFTPQTIVYQLFEGPGGFCWTMYSHTVADLDGDGDQDFVLSRVESWAEVFWLENTGSDLSWPFHPIDLWGSFANWMYQAAATDVDGDGDQDLVASFWGAWVTDPDLMWYENTTGTGSFTDHPISSGISVHDELVVSDLDGDGDPDIVAELRDSGEVAWYRNTDGAGTYGPGQTIGQHTIPFSGLATADVDGDADDDLVVIDPDLERLSWYENEDGIGGFGPEQPVAQKTVSPERLAVGDIDSDGNVDLAVSWPGLTTWYRNESNDCNGNRVPDECEPDCNDNGLADECDIRGGASVDCDGSGSPDECDVTCPTCDVDGDLCLDEVDLDPVDPFVCGDADEDGCDDCSGGGFDPATDGANSDTDGVCDLGDCDPINNEVWHPPDPATSLRLVRQDATTTLAWDAPAETGGIAVRYDTLGSSSASDFQSSGSTDCIETDDTDQSASDETACDPGEVLFYLIRVENDCPGEGSMGTGYEGSPRSGIVCE